MDKGRKIERGDIYWVDLDLARGSETNKTRPAVIISNNIQNAASSRVIVAPITSSVKSIYPFEVEVSVADKEAKIMADQIRTVDKLRLKGYLGKLTKKETHELERAIRLVLSLE
jgi:mRNA interferase MazF